MGTKFSDISIGERFFYGGYDYVKRSDTTAVDQHGVVVSFSSCEHVQRATKLVPVVNAMIKMEKDAKDDNDESGN